jgi:hypothetical protein
MIRTRGASLRPGPARRADERRLASLDAHLRRAWRAGRRDDDRRVAATLAALAAEGRPVTAVTVGAGHDPAAVAVTVSWADGSGVSFAPCHPGAVAALGEAVAVGRPVHLAGAPGTVRRSGRVALWSVVFVDGRRRLPLLAGAAAPAGGGGVGPPVAAPLCAVG